MAFYVMPQNETEGAFLDRVGKKLKTAPKWADVPDGKMLVVLVEFDGLPEARICCTESEYKAYTDSKFFDHRAFYLVELNELIKIGSLEFAEYISGEG